MRKLWFMLAACLFLTGCNPERRQVSQYLQGLDKAVMPALQQGKVVDQVSKSMGNDGFRATWPVLRPDLVDLETKVQAAEKDLGALTVPPKAATVQQLATDETKTLDDLCTKGLALGDQVAGLPKNLAGLKQLADLRPQLDEIHVLQAKHVDLSARLQVELDNLKQAEGLK